MASLPDASTKLRMVLDYLPCEACLAQPVDDQDLLCSICARLDRQVAVRVGTRTNVLLERPTPAEAPVVIPAAPAAEPTPAPPVLRDVVVRFVSDAPVERPGSIEVAVEPLERAAPVPVLAPVPEPEPVAAVADEEPVFDDLFEYTKARDEFFDYRKAPAAAAYVPPPVVEPQPEPTPQPEPEPVPQDDFVFRPPAREDAPPAEPQPVVRDDIIPEEEVPVESPREEPEPWAPPPEPEPQPVEEEIFETQPVEEEEPVYETQLVEEEEEIVEMEVLPDEPEPQPEPTGTGDLYRLRGFDGAAETALAKARIGEIAHLSGHDPGELAGRTGLPPSKLTPWIQVADLVQEVGVPVDAAIALVAAGVAGPKGLRDADADEVADRASAFGGHAVSARDVKRWKRRA